MEKWSSQRIRELMTPIALRGMAGNKIGCARISMMVRSMSSNTRPDTLMQDRTLQAYRFLLQRTAGPYIGGYSCNGASYHASIARSLTKADRQAGGKLPLGEKTVRPRMRTSFPSLPPKSDVRSAGFNEYPLDEFRVASAFLQRDRCTRAVQLSKHNEGLDAED